MCVAIALPEGAIPPNYHELCEMEEVNPDGAGVAWVEDNQVQWLKGLTAIEVDALLSTLRDGPRLIHFRLATAGGDKPELTHPFPIEKAPRTALSGRARKVLIHNGHISDWQFYAKLQGDLPGGAWSDTRLVARLAHTRSVSILKAFTGQRFATLDQAGKIQVTGHWTELNGAHYSNMYWVGGNSYSRYYTGVRDMREGAYDTPPITYGVHNKPLKGKRGKTGHYDPIMKGWSFAGGNGDD